MVLLSQAVLVHPVFLLADIPVDGIHGNGAVDSYKVQKTNYKEIDRKRDGGTSSNAFHAVNDT